MANLFLEAADLISSANDPLNYITYENINEEQKEFLRSDLWDFQFLEAPHAVYFPGNDLLRLRTTEVNPSFEAGLNELSATIRQFKIRQTVISGQSSGTISVNYIDREDQAIKAFIHDWREKLWSLKNRYSFRKEDTIATVKLTQFNSSRKPISEWIMYAVQLQDGDADAMNKGFTSDEPSNTGEMSVTYSFEHYDYKMLNV